MGLILVKLNTGLCIWCWHSPIWNLQEFTGLLLPHICAPDTQLENKKKILLCMSNMPFFFSSYHSHVQVHECTQKIAVALISGENLKIQPIHEKEM